MAVPSDRVVGKLQALVRIPTVSHPDPAFNDTDAFRAAFGVPDSLKPIGAITVGHRLADTGSLGSAARRERRRDIVHRGRYST